MKSKLLILLTVFVFISGVWAETNDSQIYESAREKIKLKEFDEALDLLSSIENENHDNYKYYYDIGYCFFQIEDDENAQLYLRKSISLNNDFYNSHEFLGISYFYTNQFILSEVEFIRCLELDEEDYYSYYMLGKIKEVFKDYDQAMEYHMKALQYNEKDFHVNYSLANIHFDAGNNELSKYYFEICDGIDPNVYPVVSCLIQINYRNEVYQDVDILKQRLREIQKKTNDERIKSLPWFVIDTFNYEEYKIVVQEAFELSGDLYYHWIFNIYDGSGSFIKRVNLESSAVLRDFGIKYIIGIDQFKNNRRIHDTTNISFEELPGYPVMKGFVIKEIDEGLQVPASGNYPVN